MVTYLQSFPVRAQVETRFFTFLSLWVSFVSSLPCYEDRAFQIFCSPAWLFPQGTNMPPHFLDWFLRPSSLFLSRSLSNVSKEMVLHFTQHVQVFCNLNIFALVFHTVRNSSSFLFFLFDWSIVALQCVSFCRRAKWISHTCTGLLWGFAYRLVHHGARSRVPCATVVSHWLSVSYTAVYIHVNLYLPIHPTPPSPLDVQALVLYVCVSISAL